MTNFLNSLNKVGTPALILSALSISLSIQSANALELSVSNEKPRQGQTVEVTIKGDFAQAPTIEFNKSTYQTFKATSGVASTTGGDSNSYQALISMPADLKPGTYKLKVAEEERPIVVSDGKFPVQKLSLPKKVVELEPSPGEMEAVQKAKETLSSSRAWDTTFQVPSAARVSTQFGQKRIVNGKLLDDYFHSGIDYAGGLGSPVKATAPGTVILAKQGYKLHGNIVSIDHGQGVVSFYLHLSKILVKPGDTVKEGQIIGKIGQTGRANGPHLHFSLYVNKVATNPTDWYRTLY